MSDSTAPSSPPVDGITPPEAPPSSQEPKKKNLSIKLIAAIITTYGLYGLWSIILVTLIPNEQNQFTALVAPGVLVSIIMGVVFAGLLVLGAMRISNAIDLPRNMRILGLARIAGVTIPGILISIAVPLMISREPPLRIAIIEPTTREAFVAPMAVTFSLEHAVKVLKERGLTPLKYAWDFEGDGQLNQETVVPTVTAIYDRKGVYNVAAKIEMTNKTVRRVGLRLVISRAVFSVSPMEPIVDEPTRFSVAHLVGDPDEVKEVHWDFNSDGEVDETTDSTDIVHTFLRTGETSVSAKVLLTNQSQQQFTRSILVSDPKPLPFDITLHSEPKNLVSPAPFGTLFRVETDTELRDIVWDFGDGTSAEGERVGHTYQKRGIHRVVAEARAESGEIAKVSTLVHVVPQLRVSDLRFDGSVDVRNDKIVAEVPVTIELTPYTSLPLIDFFWEAPDATVLGSTETTLSAIYRREGTYIITLIAKDPAGHAMRKPITLEVQPKSSNVIINMKPEGGVAPLMVSFDASESTVPGEEVSGFEWEFIGEDERTPPQQRGAQVQKLFKDPGTYEVLLRVYTTSGKTFEESKTIVVRKPVLDACITPSRTDGPAPLGVQFDMDCTEGTPASIVWDFGDGSQTDEMSPVHVFNSPGTYTVTLTVQDDAGSYSEETLSITVYTDEE